MLDLKARPALWDLLFVDKLDKVFDVTIEHLTEGVSVLAFLLLLVNLHHIVNRGHGGSTSRHGAVPLGTEVIGST